MIHNSTISFGAVKAHLFGLPWHVLRMSQHTSHSTDYLLKCCRSSVGNLAQQFLTQQTSTNSKWMNNWVMIFFGGWDKCCPAHLGISPELQVTLNLIFQEGLVSHLEKGSSKSSALRDTALSCQPGTRGHSLQWNLNSQASDLGMRVLLLNGYNWKNPLNGLYWDGDERCWQWKCRFSDLSL